MNDHKYIAIIGAGITGLTTAYYLKKAGIKFKIFEQSDHIGGVIRTKSTKNFLYETGPNSGILGNAEIADLFEELKNDCKLEIADHTSARRLIWKKNKWHALPSGPLSAITTPLFSLYDKFRILGEPFRKKGTNPNESLAELVKRRMGKSFLNYAIDPFILGIYAGDPDYIVPKYALPKLYNLEQQYGSFIGGALKKRKEPKSDQDKKATREIFSVEGGLEKLIKALVKNIGKNNVQTNAKNISVRRLHKIFEIHYNDTVESGFTDIITTVNAHELNVLFPFIGKAKLSPITNLKYAKVTEVTIGFNKWEGVKLDAFGGLVPYREQRNILGVLYMSTLFKNRAPIEGALLTVFVGGIRREELAELNEDELKELMANEFKLMMGVSKFEPDLFKTTHYQYAIAQYGADSEERINAINSIEKEYKGLYLAGSIGNGVGIADRVKQGKDLATQIAKN
ncbi:MAG: protoporphyrinogen oxidase [Bacteroidetes bacterium]|nr:protoporphyrinogen oxidase [Bacteroidota bacterium]